MLCRFSLRQHHSKSLCAGRFPLYGHEDFVQGRLVPLLLGIWRIEVRVYQVPPLFLRLSFGFVFVLHLQLHAMLLQSTCDLLLCCFQPLLPSHAWPEIRRTDALPYYVTTLLHLSFPGPAARADASVPWLSVPRCGAASPRMQAEPWSL